MDGPSSSTSNGKDTWDKLQIILAPVGGLLTAIAVGMLGVIGTRALDRQQSAEAKVRLFSELLSKREESEATLRKEMFQSIIGSFFDSTSSSLEAKLLKMELLAQNFHEALSLSPLFRHIEREIHAAPISQAARRGYQDRVEDLESEVTRKQMIVLEAGGARHDWTLVLGDSLEDGTYRAESVELSLDGIRRRFRVTPLRADTAHRLLRVRLEIETQGSSGSSQGATPVSSAPRYTVDFDLGHFSTPMIDNTRLSYDQRVAIVLTDLSQFGAALSLMYFPGSRASLRERPYYEEILRKLADTSRAP